MEAVEQDANQPVESLQPWRFAWLTPWVCRGLLAVVLAAGFFLHWRYLTLDCPIDLSFDEAHYWDWSRQLDLSYYSKGPLVAYIIRSSCAILGDTMPGVRLPALLLSVATSLATYWLTRKLFDSHRIALGAVLLNHLVPMFVAGSVMMTIDPPFFFCWALATCFTVKALLDGKHWAWVAIGMVVGIGFLAKYAMFLWLVGLVVFMLIDKPSRPMLLKKWPWLSIGIALLFTIPVIIWNQRHGWVSLRHVARQTGASEGGLVITNVLEFIGGQLAALGPGLVVMMAGAVVYVLRGRAERTPQQAPCPTTGAQLVEEPSPRPSGGVPGEGDSAGDKYRRPMLLLACMGVPFLVIITITSFRTKIQANWPAPAYFSLMILTAYFLATRLQSRQTWRPWRVWFWTTVALGVFATPILHNTELLYRPVSWFKVKPREWDPTYKLRGWKDLAGYVDQQRRLLSPGSMVLCEKYEFAAEMAFYLPDRPKTFCVGTWLAEVQRRPRHSQYDMWPDRRLDQPQLVGKDAIFMGYPATKVPGQRDSRDPPPDLVAAFDRVERAENYVVRRRGFELRDFKVWRCYGFKGMKQPKEEGQF